MNAVLTTETTSDWVEVLEAAGVPCGPIYDYVQMFRRPTGAPPRPCAICKGYGVGRGAAHRTPIRIGDGVRVRNVAPKLGQHNAEIFGRLGLSEAELGNYGSGA